MAEMLPFFVVLFAGIFFSGLFKKLHVPWVVALLLGGIIIGPHGLGFFEVNNTIDFIGQIGLIFLMFMAGLETSLSSFSHFKGKLLFLSFINGFVPFLGGILIGYLFGYDFNASMLLGIIFVSSSIAVVIPTLEAKGLIYRPIGKSIIVTTVLQDIVSLILLSIFLQNLDPVAKLPLPIFYLLVTGLFVVLRWLLPRLRKIFSLTSDEQEKTMFQRELRSILVILIGTVISFELLGLHPIVAAFIVGLVLSDSVKSEIIIEKIRTLSYGIFIPTFFIVVGAKTDIGVLLKSKEILLLVGVVVFTSVALKFFSGYFGALMVGFNSTESKLFAVSSIPQLSTTLAVVFIGFEFGILDEKILTAMIALSVISTIISPTLMSRYLRVDGSYSHKS